MEKRITNKERYEQLIEIVNVSTVDNKEELIEFLESRIELAAKKRTGQTKTQKENEVLIEKLYEVIKNIGKPVTVTEIYEAAKDIEGITSAQKVSALVKKLVDAKTIVKTTDKRKSLFSVSE